MDTVGLVSLGTLHADAGPTITDWITAVSTFAIGVVGIALTVWQFRANGFRPRILDAYLDVSKDAIQVHIANRGRGHGLIRRISIVAPNGIAVPGNIQGIATEKFPPFALPGQSKAEVIIEAPKGAHFDEKQRIKVEWKTREQLEDLQPVDVGLFGLESSFPERALGA